MSKRARTNGSRAIERRLAEGRGKGRGAGYKPWTEIHDLASRGQANRVKSPLHGRTCHMHSLLETDWFYVFHALPGLKDIREQYPLELDETISIADRLGIVHPTAPKSQEPSVVTTDFLLTFHEPRDSDKAIAIKYSADLASQRTLEKLEVERVYWSARNINWRILTEKELPRSLVKNMRWLLPHFELTDSSAFATEQITRVRAAMEPDINQGNRSLVEITTWCDDRLGLKPGSALCVTRHLIGTRVWHVDLTIEIDPRQPLHLVGKGRTHALARALAA